MNDDFSARQRAITLRLGGRSALDICPALGRSKTWLHKWWCRYLEFGADGLYDLTRAHHQVASRIPPELERAILSIRRQLEAKTGPGARYRLIGATAILAELQARHVHPQPSLRTIDRVLQRNGIPLPRLRRPRLLPHQLYPAPKVEQSNDLHEVDLVGPIYLKGRGRRYYIWVCKDAFDGAVCLRLAYSRDMDEVLAFLGESWKTLGRPRQIQFDNAREILAGGPGHATCRAAFGSVCTSASSPSLSRLASRSTTAVRKTSMDGSSRACCNVGSAGRATSVANWPCWRKRSTANTSTLVSVA